MANLQKNQESAPRRLNDTRGAALLRYLRHPIDSIRTRRKSAEQKSRSLLKQAQSAAQESAAIRQMLNEAKIAFNDCDQARADVLFDGAATQAIKINDLVARVFSLVHVYDAEMQAGRTGYAIVRLEMAKAYAKEIRGDHNRGAAFWAIEQRMHLHPIQTRLPDLGDPDRLLVGQEPI